MALKAPYSISFCAAFILLLLLASSCRQNDLKDNRPYPPLDQQRALLAAKPLVPPVRLLDSLLLKKLLFALSADSCEGRTPGTPGHLKARNVIAAEMRSIGVDSIGNSLTQAFIANNLNGSEEGYNLIGLVRGTTSPEKFIVVTAHYDHLGTDANGNIFSGADDNASGVGGLIALAKFFKANPHSYSLLFLALDREETGLDGAINAVKYLKNLGLLQKVKLNLNIDMIARSDKNELFACGIRHYPQFKYLIDSVQNRVNVKLLMWHDDAGQEGDWTRQSDHYAFHREGIPFIYLGVEDHADYHQTSDKADKVDLSRFIENCNAAATLLLQVRNL